MLQVHSAIWKEQCLSVPVLCVLGLHFQHYYLIYHSPAANAAVAPPHLPAMATLCFTNPSCPVPACAQAFVIAPDGISMQHMLTA
eukprot:1156747-Pelagomonas_calceolata.AAC.7